MKRILLILVALTVASIVFGQTHDAPSNSGSGGYISSGNYGGTGNAAYFPSGIWANGSYSWIYGNIAFGYGNLYDRDDKWRINPTGNSWFNGGNVGIGTASPPYKLTVTGDIAATAGRVFSLSSPTYSPTYLETWGLSSSGDIYLEPAAGKNLYLTDSWSKTGILNIQFGKTVFDGGDAYFNGRVLLKYDQRLIVGYGNDINSRFEITSTSEYKHTYIDFKKNVYFRAADQTWICPMVLQWDGSVGIGFSPSYDENANHTQGYKLAVNGSIICEELKVINDVPSSDYVFNVDYKLLNLPKLERFIKENKHLPEVPSAEEFKKNGYKVGEMDNLLLKKVEELTLYIIELNKKIDFLEKKVEQKAD